MHISEGVLSPVVLGAGAALAALGVTAGLKRLDHDRLMTVAILSSAFFVASLIHVPIGPASAHLVLNGLLGVMLGWAAFPAIFVALALQALLFQFGGLTVLGVNTFNMALPPVLCYYVFRPMLHGPSRLRGGAAFACGFLSVGASALLTAVSLGMSGVAFIPAARALMLAHIPVMIVEGVVTALVVSFIARVRPEMLAFTSTAHG